MTKPQKPELNQTEKTFMAKLKAGQKLVPSLGADKKWTFTFTDGTVADNKTLKSLAAKGIIKPIIS